jgi:hypothetical protein
LPVSLYAARAAILPMRSRHAEGIQEASQEGCASTARLASPRRDEAVATRTEGEAASLKLLAHNEEWLVGERQKSKARSRL